MMGSGIASRTNEQGWEVFAGALRWHRLSIHHRADIAGGLGDCDEKPAWSTPGPGAGKDGGKCLDSGRQGRECLMLVTGCGTAKRSSIIVSRWRSNCMSGTGLGV